MQFYPFIQKISYTNILVDCQLAKKKKRNLKDSIQRSFLFFNTKSLFLKHRLNWKKPNTPNNKKYNKNKTHKSKLATKIHLTKIQKKQRNKSVNKVI